MMKLSLTSLCSSILAGFAAGCPPTVDDADACGQDLPASLSVVEGGKLTLPRSSDVRDVRATDDVQATIGDETITLRIPMGAAERTITVVCAAGEKDIAVDVQPLTFTSVVEWVSDEEPGIPSGREYFAWWLSPDADERALYLYGGFAYEPLQFTPRYELYRFDLTSSSWSSVAQGGTLPDPGGRVAVSERGVHYFGGARLATDGSLITEPGFFSWRRTDDGAAFESMPSGASGPGSYTGALMYDSKRDRWLSVCGADAVQLGIHCAVHAYVDDGGWQALDVEGAAPSGRMGFHFAYDEENDRVVLYGGQGAGATDVFGDTWALELSPERPAWVPLPNADGAERRNGAYAFDPLGQRLIVWGGTANGSTALAGVDVLTLDRGAERWDHVEPSGDAPGPAARASGQCLYDDEEARLLCGFGNAQRVYTDLWALPLLPSPP